MVVRYRSHHPLRDAFTLGTGLTALFLLVRCSVTERDYSRLGLGDENIGSAGRSGSAGGGAGGTGQGGTGGQGDVGGQAGTGGTPLQPVPCTNEDAGTPDASADGGSDDAGADDAGAEEADPIDAVCACVDGFIQAVDADGDGEGTQACSVAPGLDCDDGDAAITHNGCGGCTALPNAIGADCLDCGTFACDGPDALACAAKPDPVEDPDCRCVAGEIVARDTDGDGQGTRLCEFNPGVDCNDGDGAYITNQCGGCAELAGAVGDICNQCGVYACSGNALTCVPGPPSCVDGNTRQACVGTGFWGTPTDCTGGTSICYQGNCEVCTPGTFQCVDLGNGSNLLQLCITDASLGSSYYGIGWGSYASCSLNQTCDAANGMCLGSLLLPRDRTFDVAPLQRHGLPWHELLNTAAESDYG